MKTTTKRISQNEWRVSLANESIVFKKVNADMFNSDDPELGKEINGWYNYTLGEVIDEAVKILQSRVGVEAENKMIDLVINDGGRSKYFKADVVGDCVTRAIAIASGRDYKEVYDELYKIAKKSPRNGVAKAAIRKYMKIHGYEFHALMGIGTGCQHHLFKGEIPMEGRMILSLSGHCAAVIDGVLHDTYDSRRGGNRCVYGYWLVPEEGKTPEPPKTKKRTSKEKTTKNPKIVNNKPKSIVLDKLPKSYTETCICKGKTYVRKHVKEILGNETRGYSGSYTWFGGCIPSSSVYTDSGLTREKMEKQLLENLNKEINRDRSKSYESVEYSFEW